MQSENSHAEHLAAERGEMPVSLETDVVASTWSMHDLEFLSRVTTCPKNARAPCAW